MKKQLIRTKNPSTFKISHALENFPLNLYFDKPTWLTQGVCAGLPGLWNHWFNHVPNVHEMRMSKMSDSVVVIASRPGLKRLNDRESEPANNLKGSKGDLRPSRGQTLRQTLCQTLCKNTPRIWWTGGHSFCFWFSCWSQAWGEASRQKVRNLVQKQWQQKQQRVQQRQKRRHQDHLGACIWEHRQQQQRQQRQQGYRAKRLEKTWHAIKSVARYVLDVPSVVSISAKYARRATQGNVCTTSTTSPDIVMHRD